MTTEPTYTITISERERTALARALGLLVAKLTDAPVQITQEVPPAKSPHLHSFVDLQRSGIDTSSPAAAPAASPVAPRDRWARDKFGVEVPNPSGAIKVTVHLWKAERNDLQDGRKRMKVTWDNPQGPGHVDAACWDDRLFPFLVLRTKEITTVVYVTKSGKYLNVVGVNA